MEHSQNPVVGSITFGSEFSYVQAGWECPKCKRVYSPTTPMCLYCQPLKIEIVTDPTKNLLNECRNL